MEGEDGMKRKLHTSMAVNIIAVTVLLLVILGVMISTLGFLTFSDTIIRQYTESTRHMANTAASMINGDHVEAYLNGEYPKEYRQTAARLEEDCRTMNVSLIYLIDVDRSDYGRFVSVFNAVNNDVDNSSYTPWELGYRRDTTNDEYRTKYRLIYEQQETFQTIFRRSTRDGQHPHITSMVPVKDSTGEVKAILCMQRPISEIDEVRKPYILIVVFSTILLCIIAALLLTAYLRRKFVRPILRVSDEATRFAKENTKGEDLAGISRYTELANLAGSIDKMETDMVRYMDNLTAVTAEKERISAELSLARTIQANSIPNVFPPFPERDEFDIFASMNPAREVGGDFYNFFLIDDDHLGVVIGDVSGKGIPAALFMMVTNILISDRTRMGSTPGEILRYVNNAICERNTADMFVTVWLAILELSTGRLTASNAGHEYPVLKRADGKYELYKDIHGFVVGGMNGITYKEYELQLNPGDRLFVYTDGVPEATDSGNELFGTDRMLEALNRDPEAKPEALLKSVRDAVDGFVKEAEQFDDLTMLCLEYNGSGRK